MTLAEEKYKTLKLKGLWDAPTKEEASIVAMKAALAMKTEMEGASEFLALKAEVAKLKGKSGKGRKGEKDNDWAWKLVAPTGSQPKEKSFRGKQYIYCMFHGDTKWVLKEKHAKGCRNDPAYKSKDDNKPDPGKLTSPSKKTLSYAKAFMHAMEAEGGDDDEGVPDEDT